MIQVPNNLNTESANSQEATTNQPTYEQLLAERIAQEHLAISKQFGVPLWMLRSPGPQVEVEDDDLLD